jgi:hypothetical protein
VEVQKHPALSIESFISQFGDKSIRSSPLAQALNVQEIFHLHARFTVLAEDGIGYGG